MPLTLRQQSKRNNTASEDDVESSKCGTCNKLVRKNDQAGGLQCDICNFWFHAKTCQKLSQLKYDALIEDDDEASALQWYCDRCRVVAKGVMQNITTLTKRLDDLSSDLQNIKDQQTNLESSASITKTGVTKNTTDIRGLANDVVRLDKRIDMVSSESDEIYKRRSNIVIRGLPENNEVDIKDLVISVISEIGKPEIGDIRVSRIGDRRDDGNPRPVRVFLQSETVRDEILNCASKLKNMTSNDLLFDPKRVFISKDLTRLQRQRAFDNRRYRRYNNRIRQLETRTGQPGGVQPPQNEN